MPDGFANIESWNNDNVIHKLLPLRITTSRLVVVLGAGASIGCGLPTWTNLINKAYVLNGAVRVATHNDAQAAEHFFTSVANRDERVFAELIGKALYHDLDEGKALQNELLNAIGAVVMLTSRKGTGTVITYNFDDLLETYLNYRGIFAYPVIKQPSWFHNEDVSILHPHGFVALSSSFPSSDRITFTSLHFDMQTGKNDDPWRKKTTDVLERNVPLFIGLSGDDSNLSSQLAEIKERHVSRNDLHPFWGIRISLASDNTNDFWTNRGIWCLTVENYSQIPSLLMTVCKASANILRSREIA